MQQALDFCALSENKLSLDSMAVDMASTLEFRLGQKPADTDFWDQACSIIMVYSFATGVVRK